MQGEATYPHSHGLGSSRMGLFSVRDQSTEEARNAWKHVHEAVQCLPPALVKDYKFALETVPELVSMETHPLKFLRSEAGDVWKAARRLVQNWSLRRELFGEASWCRPMRLFDGALTKEDVVLMQTGAFSVLTVPSDDSLSETATLNLPQTVICDFALLNQRDYGTANIVANRCRIFYYLEATTYNIHSQQQGLDIFLILDGNGVRLSQQDTRELQATQNSAVGRVRRVFIVDHPLETRRTLQHLIGHIIRGVVANVLGKDRLISIPQQDSPSATARILSQVHGLHMSIIPSSLGGHGMDLPRWLQVRHQEEVLHGTATMFPGLVILALAPTSPNLATAMVGGAGSSFSSFLLDRLQRKTTESATGAGDVGALSASSTTLGPSGLASTLGELSQWLGITKKSEAQQLGDEIGPASVNANQSVIAQQQLPGQLNAVVPNGLSTCNPLANAVSAEGILPPSSASTEAQLSQLLAHWAQPNAELYTHDKMVPKINTVAAKSVDQTRSISPKGASSPKRSAMSTEVASHSSSDESRVKRKRGRPKSVVPLTHDQLRQRNAVYSQRYYERRKEKDTALLDEEAALKTEQLFLRAEQERLQSLLAQATTVLKEHEVSY